MATSTPVATTQARMPLNRARVLDSGLAYVDEHGLDALSMHKLGAHLGVRGMSLYNHVEGKDDLLDGISALLWGEIDVAALRERHWQHGLRDLAHAIRGVVARHPNAAPLLMRGIVMSEPGLWACEACLTTLERAGFDHQRAADAVRAVVGHALGFAALEGSWAAPALRDGPQQEGDLRRVRLVSRALPEDAPDRLVEVAMAICAECDMDDQFELGLSLMIDNLDS